MGQMKKKQKFYSEGETDYVSSLCSSCGDKIVYAIETTYYGGCKDRDYIKIEKCKC